MKWNALVALLLATGLIYAKKSADDVKKPKAGETEDVVVLFRVQPTEKHDNKGKSNGGRLKRKYNQLPAAAYSVSAKGLQDLEDDDDVLSITPDRQVRGATLGEALGAVHRWDIEPWYNANGNCRGCTNNSPVGVAVIDSGVGAHADFNWWGTTTSRVVYSQSFVDSTTADGYGHGTHVAGILGSDGNIWCLQGGLTAAGDCRATQQFTGVAPGVHIVSLKVLDSNGVGTDSAVIAAIDRAIQLKSTYNIRVMNLSLGRPVRESYKLDPLCQAVERAWNAGIVVVVAAGNEGRNNSVGTKGYGTITSPGNDPLVITVGALYTGGNWWDADDRIATYSSKGPTAIDQIVKPDLVAPGNNIIAQQAAGSRLVTTYPANRPAVSSYWPWATGTSQYYFALNGTSMATPVVSGAAALLIDKDRSLTPNQVKARLMKYARRGLARTASVYDAATATTYSLTHDMFTVGAGVLNIGPAFYATDKPAGSSASPKAVYNSSTKKVSLNFAATGGTNVIWGEAATNPFSTNVIWGENVIWGTNVIWGENVIWGTSSSAGGFNVIWGTTGQIPGSPSATALALLANGDK